MLPEFKERVWGTRSLAPYFDRTIAPGGEPIGEVWLSGDENRVANGPLAGQRLADLCRRLGHSVTGRAARPGDRFPLLVKFLFPRDKLSVQVHPDDEAARRDGEPCGKTETWHVLAAAKGATIALGLQPGTTRAGLEQAIASGHAEEMLRWLEIRAGDTYFSPAGTVHAIGAGSILVETQQNSDTTLRLYDYGRGRPLHVEHGLAVMKETTAAGKVEPQASEEGTRLVASDHFVVHREKLSAPRELRVSAATPQVLVALAGCGVVESPGCQPVTFNRGQAVIVPAALPAATLRPQWELEYLRMRLP
jgi:mannose-6-phosphate isomerase